MRRMIAFGLAVWLGTAGFFALPVSPATAQDGAILGDAPYLEDGMVIAAAGDDIVQAAAVPAVDLTSRATSANFFFSYYVGEPAVGWTGSQASCNAGTTSSEFKAAVIDRVAFYRAMAGVPSNVGLSASASVANQQAALMFSRNNQLSHTPGSSWACYTSSGAQAAGSSNIALGIHGTGAIDAYMKDAGGGNTAAGHRRWILFPQTQSFGTGDVPGSGSYSSANSLAVWDANAGGPRPNTRDGYVAWPPPGYVPYQVVFPRWSFSYPGASFAGASITVTANGSNVPVSIDSSSATGYGENTIVFRLNGMSDGAVWANPGADITYAVRISGVVASGQSRTFTYNVTVFDPSSGDPGPATSTPTRTTTPSATPTVSPTVSATPSPTTTPTSASASNTPNASATRTPTTIPGGFAIGEQFIVTTSLSLRSGPGSSYPRIAVVPSGTTGTVTGPPVSANGYTFYPVSIPGYQDGWMAGEYFARTSNPSPTGTPTSGASATRTATAAAPTITPSATVAPPTFTRTATSAPSTATRTATMPPPTVTQSPTVVPPATSTNVPGAFQVGDTVRTTASVNFRSGPSTGSSVITVVPIHTLGTVIGDGVVDGTYTFIPLDIPGLGSGWIVGQYLTLVTGNDLTATAIAAFPAGTTVYTTVSLHIRSGPGNGNSSVGVATKGTSATVTGPYVQAPGGIWYPLQVTGIGAGWASAVYLSPNPTVQGPQAPTAEPQVSTATSEPGEEPPALPSEIPATETPLPTATATVIDVMTPTESVPLPGTPTSQPTEEAQVSGPIYPTETPELTPPLAEAPWLPIARVQRSPDSETGQVLVDGDPNTVWVANGAGQPLAMFVLDLGQVSPVSQILWQTGASGISGTLYVQVSADNVEWVDLDPTLAYATEDGWFALDAPVTAQFIRFVFVNDSAADWLGGVSDVRIMP